MSSLSEVLTGMLRLLLTAWQVKTASRSAREMSDTFRALVAVSPSEETSKLSSTSRWDRHQVRRGGGWPVVTRRERGKKCNETSI